LAKEHRLADENKNIHRKRSRANVSSHRINHRRIQRRSIEQQKNAASAIAGNITGPRVNSATIMKGTPSAMLAAETK